MTWITVAIVVVISLALVLITMRSPDERDALEHAASAEAKLGEANLRELRIRAMLAPESVKLSDDGAWAQTTETTTEHLAAQVVERVRVLDELFQGACKQVDEARDEIARQDSELTTRLAMLDAREKCIRNLQQRVIRALAILRGDEE